LGIKKSQTSGVQENWYYKRKHLNFSETISLLPIFGKPEQLTNEHRNELASHRSTPNNITMHEKAHHNLCCFDYLIKTKYSANLCTRKAEGTRKGKSSSPHSN
jgi:hypothetical protein